MNHKTGNREYSLDAYRIFMMLGICWLHVSGRDCGHPTQWMANLAYWCVPGFVFITGWFGLKMSIIKLVKLYLVAAYAVVMVVFLRTFLSGTGGGIEFAIKLYRNYWFLNSYAFLMLMAPTLNKITEDNLSLCYIPILFIVFVWGFLNSFPPVWSIIPKSNGVEPFSGVMMMGVYIVGRLFRRQNLIEKISPRRCIIYFMLSLLVAAVGLCSYCSPFSLVIAIVVFFALKNNGLAHRIGKRSSWMVPSLFSIYLLHSHEFGFRLIMSFEDGLLNFGLPLFGVHIVSAVGVFSACLLLDLPRRLIVKGAKKVYLGITARKFV